MQVFQCLLHELLLVVNFLGDEGPLEVKCHFIRHLFYVIGGSEVIVNELFDLWLELLNELVRLLVKTQALVLTRLPNVDEVDDELIFRLFQDQVIVFLNSTQRRLLEEVFLYFS